MAGGTRRPYVRCMQRLVVGELVRDWRTRRHRSQLDLALEIGVSARHLSFVETGRSKPSPELVLALAERLEVPLRERNAMLLAAGYAPRYGETPLSDPSMAVCTESLQRSSTRTIRIPAWSSIGTGTSCSRTRRVTARDRVPDGALGSSPQRVPRVPSSRRPRGPHSQLPRLGRLSAQPARIAVVVLTNDAELIALQEEVNGYPNVQAIGGAPRWATGTSPRCSSR